MLKAFVLGLVSLCSPPAYGADRRPTGRMSIGSARKSRGAAAESKRTVAHGMLSSTPRLLSTTAMDERRPRGSRCARQGGRLPRSADEQGVEDGIARRVRASAFDDADRGRGDHAAAGIGGVGVSGANSIRAQAAMAASRRRVLKSSRPRQNGARGAPFCISERSDPCRYNVTEHGNGHASSRVLRFRAPMRSRRKCPSASAFIVCFSRGHSAAQNGCEKAIAK